MRALTAGEDPHLGGPPGQLVPGRAFAQQPGQLGDVRLFDPAPAVPAVQVAAGALGAPLADLAALIDGDLPGLGRDGGDRGPLPLAQLPANRVDHLVAGPGGELVQPGDQVVAGPRAVTGDHQPPPEGGRQRGDRGAQHRRRAAFTAAVILPSARSPPRAISSSVRHTVGTEATSPNSSSWSPITRKSLITSAPSAIAQARSASTRPRSWTRYRRDASAFDSPAVRPILSASALISATPACDTIPVPSAVTCTPFSQPVVFTL